MVQGLPIWNNACKCPTREELWPKFTNTVSSYPVYNGVLDLQSLPAPSDGTERLPVCTNINAKVIVLLKL